MCTRNKDKTIVVIFKSLDMLFLLGVKTFFFVWALIGCHWDSLMLLLLLPICDEPEITQPSLVLLAPP